MIKNLFSASLDCIQQPDPCSKVTLTNCYKSLWDNNNLELSPSGSIVKINAPGRPDKPILVHPRELPKRKLNSVQGKAALIHAVCHIEFNAINLAWDAIYRFQDMPREYYSDWLQIAYEEAKHFSLLHGYLKELGFNYGDFPAHDGLWALAVSTDYDILARMALVPRVMEARGLDVTPGMIDKFVKINDNRAVEILNIILAEEQGHVAVGNKWFNYLCNIRKLEPLDTFKTLIKQHIKGQIKPPFSKELRLASGFTEDEIELLENIQS